MHGQVYGRSLFFGLEADLAGNGGRDLRGTAGVAGDLAVAVGEYDGNQFEPGFGGGGNIDRYALIEFFDPRGAYARSVNADVQACLGEVHGEVVAADALQITLGNAEIRAQVAHRVTVAVADELAHIGDRRVVRARAGAPALRLQREQRRSLGDNDIQLLLHPGRYVDLVQHLIKAGQELALEVIVLAQRVHYVAHYAARGIDPAEEVGVLGGVVGVREERDAHVHIQQREVPLVVESGRIVGRAVAPDFDVVFGPVAGAEVQARHVHVDKGVYIQSVGHVFIV